jgi:hypothetical protein
MIVARLTEKGLARVLEGKVGMTFIVDRFGGVGDKVAMLRDYRYPGDHFPYQIWAVGEGGYEIMSEEPEKEIGSMIGQMLLCLIKLTDDQDLYMKNHKEEAMKLICEGEKLYEKITGHPLICTGNSVNESEPKYLGLFGDIHIESEVNYEGYERMLYDPPNHTNFAECKNGGGTVNFIGISSSPKRGAPVDGYIPCFPPIKLFFKDPFTKNDAPITPVIMRLEI